MPQMQQSLSHDGKLFCITTNHIEPTCMYTLSNKFFFNMDIKRPELSVHIMKMAVLWRQGLNKFSNAGFIYWQMNSRSLTQAKPCVLGFCVTVQVKSKFELKVLTCTRLFKKLVLAVAKVHP